MPISLILTPFGHFHFRQTLAVKCIPDLRVRLTTIVCKQMEAERLLVRECFVMIVLEAGHPGSLVPG